MRKYLQSIIIVLIVNACGQGGIKAPINAMEKLDEFKEKKKFLGVADSKMRQVLIEKINQVAEDFKEIVIEQNPTDKKYQEKIGIGLKRFSGIYLDIDTEDREQVCNYFEELMDIVELKSSNGQLNEFMYGFDPTNQ